jgi:signal transduction histidine kinase
VLPLWRDVRGTVVVVLAAFAWAVACANGLVSRSFAATFSGYALWILPIAAGGVCFRVMRRYEGRYRLGWAFLGTAAISWGLGSAAWTFLEHILHIEPFPSVADIGFLAAIPLAAAGIVCFTEAPKRSFSRLRTLLDGALIASSVLIISWTLVLGDVFYNSSGSIAAQIISLAYPVGDVVIVSVVVFLWARAASDHRVTLFTIGVALMCLALADSTFAVLVQHHRYHTGHPIDMGWLGGYLLFGVAALQSRMSAPLESRIERARSNLPYAVAGIAFVTVIVTAFFHREIALVEVWSLVAILVILVARQFFMFAEQQRMTIAQLESVDEMKTGILYAVSHELRTPLTFIKGAAELLDTIDFSPEDRKDMFGKLRTNCDRLDNLISSLLDIGRLSRGVLNPRRTETDVRLLLMNVADTIDARDHRIRVGGERVVASVDPAQVERIVENLFANAVRHTPAGTQVNALAQRVEEGIMITVADNGPGIPAELQQNIFEPFVQVVPLADLNHGTGIGLALVKKLAELHGGSAWVECGADGGAAFRVFLADDAPAAA